MDAKLKALIVDEHNQFRSKIATGKQEYAPGRFYPQAARMVTMVCIEQSSSKTLLLTENACSNGTMSWHTLLVLTLEAATSPKTNVTIQTPLKLPDRILLRKFTQDNRTLHHLSKQFFNLGMEKAPTQTPRLLPVIHRT